MNIKSSYYKMSKEDFNKYLSNIKSSINTIHLLSNTKYSCFYYPDQSIYLILLDLHKSQWEFDYLLHSFSSFAQNQIVQSFLIEEIVSTNNIENIQSTRHDIFSILNDVKDSKDKNIISIVNRYKLLLEGKGQKISSLLDIKNTYDQLLKDSISKSDIPDGEYFRKKEVYISDGIRNIHNGIMGEENINNAMNEFIDVYNSSFDIYERMIISHYMFETIHPYYDGNGRLGRYLFSNGLYLETNSILSLLISCAFNKKRKDYYKSFKIARDVHEFGCINSYVETICKLLLEESKIFIGKLKDMKEKISSASIPSSLTKSEKIIYSLLVEATILSDYGISSKEIMSETNISKRTLIYTLNHFKDMGILSETKIGRFTYYKIKM